MLNQLKTILLSIITILTLTACSGGSGGIGAALGVDIIVVDGYIGNAKVIDSNGNIAKYKSNGTYTFTPAPIGTITVTGGVFEDTGLPNIMIYKVSATSRVISPITSFLYKYSHLQDKILTALGVSSLELLGDFVKSNKIEVAKLAQLIYAMNVNSIEDDFANRLTNDTDPTDIDDIFAKVKIVVTANNPIRATEIEIFLDAVAVYVGSVSDFEVAIETEKKSTHESEDNNNLNNDNSDNNNSDNDSNSTQIYTITTTLNTGGNITPSSVSVDSGDTTYFTAISDSNYTISSVSGCGGSLSGNIYTTGVITQNCIVNVVFNNNTPAEAKSFIQAIADGDAEPIIVDGKEWTFRTPPPPEDERTVRDNHPRLLLTTDNLPEIRVKLQDPVYTSYMNNIISRADAGNMFENAFLYQLNGDIARGNIAKNALLNYSGDYGERIIYGYDSMSNKYGPILVFDWIMDMLNESEKTQIFANIKDNFNYDHQAASPQKDDSEVAGGYPWYFNDVYNRHPEIYLPALAFAIHDEGIDDLWADEVITWAYDEDETRVVGPYGANRGSGFLDVLMTMSLDTGGFSDASTEYYNYWMEAVHAVSFWETATGQPMWSRSPWLEKGPQSLLTSREGIRPGSRIMSAIEFVTGQYGGDTASLAKYVTNYYGASSYHVVHRAILGDMRVVEKTPTEIGIPTADYLRGDHVFYSKSSWEDNAVSLYVRSLYMDVGRGVGSEGVFAIDIGNREPLSPRVQISKTQEIAGYSSGMWIYDPMKTDRDGNPYISSKQNGGTFWSGSAASRSHDAWTTVSQAPYYKAGPDAMEVTDKYRAISMEYGQRYEDIIVNQAQRTVVHIPDVDRNFIVVYDYVDVPTEIKSAWQMRLMETPIVNESEFSIVGKMSATVVSPQNHTIEWVGGNNDEFRTPSPEKAWYTSRKGGSVPGYSVDRPSYVNGFGLGNIYIQPEGQRDASVQPYVQQTEYLVVMEIGNQIPVNVTRMSDCEVRFGNWQILFNRDGSYVVTKL